MSSNSRTPAAHPIASNTTSTVQADQRRPPWPGARSGPGLSPARPMWSVIATASAATSPAASPRAGEKLDHADARAERRRDHQYRDAAGLVEKHEHEHRDDQ